MSASCPGPRAQGIPHLHGLRVLPRNALHTSPSLASLSQPGQATTCPHRPPEPCLFQLRSLPACFHASTCLSGRLTTLSFPRGGRGELRCAARERVPASQSGDLSGPAQPPSLVLRVMTTGSCLPPGWTLRGSLCKLFSPTLYHLLFSPIPIPDKGPWPG